MPVESVAEYWQVKNWMSSPISIRMHQTIRDAAEIMHQQKVRALPVVNYEGELVGQLTIEDVLSELLLNPLCDSLVEKKSANNVEAVRTIDSMIDIGTTQSDALPVVDPYGNVAGMITPKTMLHFYSHLFHTLQQKKKTDEILNTILESAYEGIAVVDEFGILLEFNQAYSRFTGISREDAIGRHVTEVIDNTNLHMTVKTAIPERGVIQNIQGQDMVVHRIPIWDEGKVVGAIGMLIFEGVTEIYKIYEDLQQSYRLNQMEKEAIFPKIKEEAQSDAAQILGASEKISDVKRLARKAARTPATVLITGESGTGKEVFARNIHYLSSSKGPFVSVNCGAIPEALFESELFGYEEGAFTGAKKGGKAGKFELAKNGTIFLDEIGEMPLPMQTKLLRVLQEKEAERVGGNQKYPIDARVIAATNRNLEKMVDHKKFREDLYYRLNIIQLHIPPLRERTQDIPILISYYLRKVCDKYQIPRKVITSEAVSVFMGHHWKGNIRELVNVIEQLVTLVDNHVIDWHDLPDTMFENNSDRIIEGEMARLSLLEEAKNMGEQMEREAIIKALREAGGNKSKAAVLLGIHRTTLYQKLKKYQIQ